MNIIIKLKLLQPEDAEALLKFEAENRAFFETMVPSRGDEYYHIPNFLVRHEALLEDQSEGRASFYLIKDSHNILGRINIVDLNDNRKVGHLGYRIGKIHTGKGVATQALSLLLKDSIATSLRQLHAKTTMNNISSQKVLQKNGFIHEKTEKNSFEMYGEFVKFIHYTWTNPEY
ncbi:GNAT family N-acetyltransferase [Virgibacillus proomii]|uniref:GNAT family N-acetyltransferase n=1 Tax=Virgibacillus proomii TaxID=84407 RepID=UPI0031831885